MTTELLALADRVEALSDSMKHVILRCSDAGSWADSTLGMGRQWPDLVHGRAQTAFSTVRALVDREILYEDADGLFGLTQTGLAMLLELRAIAHASRVGDRRGDNSVQLSEGEARG